MKKWIIFIALIIFSNQLYAFYSSREAAGAACQIAAEAAYDPTWDPDHSYRGVCNDAIVRPGCGEGNPWATGCISCATFHAHVDTYIQHTFNHWDSCGSFPYRYNGCPTGDGYSEDPETKMCIEDDFFPGDCAGGDTGGSSSGGSSSGGSKGPDDDSNFNGNPCDASTGNKFQIETDYTSKTLSFKRYYHSRSGTLSVLGRKWTHNYLAYFKNNFWAKEVNGEPHLVEYLSLKRPNGSTLVFNFTYGNGEMQATGEVQNDANITEQLTKNNDTWELKRDDDAIEVYAIETRQAEDERHHETYVGKLLRVVTKEGLTTTYDYVDDKLNQVTDPYGRSLTFAYDESGRLITLTTPENTTIHYSYDDNTNNLISVTYPDNTPNDLTDNPKKIYHYEEANFPNYLTGITNENGHRYASWAYNAEGKAIMSEHANGAERIDLVYNPDNSTTVTDALGRAKTYTFETHFGHRKPSTIAYAYHDGQQQVNKQKQFSYYADTGWVKTKTDYNGHVTYYEYNDRGLVTLKTTTYGTTDAYTISTTWHPDYRLPATRTYPDRTVTYSYDSKGQLTHTQTTTVQ